MALSDPQSVTVNAVAKSLPRISTGNNASTYSSADGEFKLSVAHTTGKRVRRLARLSQDKIVVNPLNTATNLPVSGSVRFTADYPLGTVFTVAEQAYLASALAAWITANATVLFGGQN